MNVARAEQQRLAPVRELRNIGGELHDYGGQSLHRAQPHKGNLQRKVHFCEARRCIEERGTHRRRVAHQPHQHLRLGLIGNHVGRMAAVNLPDVQRAGPHVFAYRQFQFQQLRHHLHQFVHGALAEFGIRRVPHLARRAKHRAQSALRRQRQAIVRGLAVDQEAAAFGCKIRGFRARRIALFARDKQQSNPKPCRAQRLRQRQPAPQ